MNWKDIDKRQLITILACFIGTFILSIIRVQPSGVTYELGEVNAYASLGGAGIFASVLILGFPWGVITSVAGLILGDIVMGSKLFIIGNLLIGTGMALFVSAFAIKCNDWKKCFVVAGMTEAIMVIGFFIYDLLIVREFNVVGIAALLQFAQGLICGAIGTVILKYLPPMHPEKMLVIRRSPDER
ncbi:MAG TPA: hypothetical protein VN453_01840 [Feifaniaceae bacterium]|nr:hypothetical protein [Feifaniaceae bacterium]